MSPPRVRHRYIAFQVEGPRAFTRDEVLEALHGLREPPWLVVYEEGRGLVRCTHRKKEDTIRDLGSIRRIAGETVLVSTVGTSGTIRRATAKYLR